MKCTSFRLGLLLVFCLLTISAVNAYDLTVAKDGSGNFTSIQAAINAAPTGATTTYTIFIKNGKYREKITIPSNKPFISLIGESVANTFVYYDDPATILGTQGSASVSINATDFTASNITFANTYGNGSQAVAVLVNADRAIFYNCRFLGNQDTLYVKGAGTPKSYFKNCYIDGNIDFIFGSGVALFDSCVIYPKNLGSSNSSYITAPNTPTGQSYGFVFNSARLPANTGTTNYYLSRPWPSPSEAATAQKAVFLNSKMTGKIFAAGWSVWDANTITANTYYGEYQSAYFSGTPVNTSGRASWSYQLSALNYSTYTISNMFGSWNPCTVLPGICNPAGTDIAVANFAATKGSSSSQFTWNISWPITGIQYELYRSSDNSNFTLLNSQTAGNDTAINFSYTDANPPAGQSYYYFVKASKAGLASHFTDTLSISSIPTITLSGSPGSFQQGLGTPSATQFYSVAGVNLTANIDIIPPAGYEISSNGGTSWTAGTLNLTQSGGVVTSTSIAVRLNSGTTGTFSGNITHSSTGAPTALQPVAGTVQSTPLAPSTVLQQWFLTSNNADDAATRSPGVVSTSPVFSKLFLSNGTTVVAVPAYSSTHGQAYGPSSGGDGLWSSVGGNLGRTFYEQFTVTAATGYTVRLDSLVLNSSFYNTSSNTKLAVVYSRSGFTTDSANVTGGYGPAGAVLAGSANGAFATPILLTNETAGTNANYRIAFNSSTGITLASGQTLTIRIYNSCGSSSTGRYGKMKNIAVKGYACNPPAITGQPVATQTVCKDEPTSALVVVATGTSLTYTWYVNSIASTSGASAISGASGATYTPSSAVAGTSFYYCVISGGCGTVTSGYSQVTVNPNYTIIASAGANGSISSAGVTTLTCNGTGSKTYNITPASSCYSIADVLVDGVSQGAVSTYTFTNVTAAHTISASFVINTYNITVTAGANGTVTPATGAVDCGSNATYSIAANPTYVISDVLVDGISQGAITTYTFTNVTTTHTISASFVSVCVPGNWIGGNGNWSDAANWSCNTLPSTGTAITISSGNPVLDVDFTVANSLTLSGTGALTVSPAATLTVSGTANFNGQSVTFKSDNSGTASLGQVTGTITGASNVTVERYLPNNGFRSWRLLSVPTFGTQTIKQAWQEGNAPLVNNTPGYGMQLAATGSVPAVQAAGFDNASSATSIQRYSGTAWINLTSTLTPISNQKAYFVFVRGDRTQGVFGVTTQTTATTLRTKGSIYTGTQSSGTIGANTFQVLGNPFVSAIDFTGLNRTGGVKNTFYIWDSKKQSGTSLGAYQTFSATSGFACLLGGGSYTLGAPNTTIQSGQAFFVETDASSGSVSFPESAKVASNGTFGFRPTTPASALVKIDTRLYTSNGNLADANVVVFDDAYGADVDSDDALKLGNPGENFAILRNNQSLAVEGRPTIAAEDVVDFKIWNLQQQQYRLEFAASNMVGLTAVLEDKFLNSRTRIDLATINSVNFTVTADAASKAAGRFRLVFAPAAPLPVSFLSVSANRTTAGVQASWKVAAERNINRYEVERSENGRNFVKAGTVTATGNNNDETYGFNDATAPAGTLFYRVKSIGTAGEVKYSSIVKVAAGAVKAGYSIAPNPVEGGVVNLQFTNQPAGLYSVRVLNIVGQSLMTQQAVHAGDSSTQVLNLSANIARGTYQVEIIAPDNTRTTQSLIVNSK